jgi:hypothetical protein
MLHCDECGRISANGADGWVAVRLDLEDDPERVELAIFCPSCVEREFGGEFPVVNELTGPREHRLG